MKLGFPRALMYYEYYPFWAGFFHKLNVELVTSPLTNREIMERGLKKAPDETCLPIKLLVGHLNSFDQVDGIFLPRMVSIEKDTYLCPKILGLPESVQYAMEPNMKVYTVDMNWRKGKKDVLKNLRILGDTLGCGKKQVRNGLDNGKYWLQSYRNMRTAGWSFEESMECFENLAEPSKLEKLGIKPVEKFRQKEISVDDSPSENTRPTIALVGHNYITYEPYANLKVLERLQEKANVVVVENINGKTIEEKQSTLRKKIFWSHAKNIYGAGDSYVDNPQVDGIIFLSCFGCGTDSMINDLLGRRARMKEKPYMVVTIDEHSGEAGIVTRLEAFLDMLERRIQNESYLSTHG